MQNMASESKQKKNHILPIIGSVVLLALVIAIIFLSVGRKEQSVAYESTLSEITQVASALTANAELINEVSSATPTVVLPEATATFVEPTEVPDMAIPVTSLDDQDIVDIKYICMDNDFDYAITEYSSFKEGFSSYREAEVVGNVISAYIPVLSCMVEVEFQQAITDDIKVTLYQTRDLTPWYEKVLLPIEEKPNTYYAIVNHQYVIDPPYWGLNYKLKIEDNEKIYWDGILSLTRAFSGLCWEGSIPDPVSLECPRADALEREPHIDMPTLVPGGLPK